MRIKTLVGDRASRLPNLNPHVALLTKWLFGFWRGHVHLTTIEPSTRQLGFPA